MPSSLFLSVMSKQKQGIVLFKILYILVCLFTLFGIWSLYTFNNYALFVLSTGKTFGQAAILVYILTLLPGIARRLHIQHELLQILMVYRRYIGILMYLFVFTHLWFLYGVDVIASGSVYFPIPWYIVMGIIAHSLLLLLFVTSNDVSTKKLGIWWNRIHQVTYVAVWFIFLHVALHNIMQQTISIWTILIGITSFLVLASHLYPKLKR